MRKSGNKIILSLGLCGAILSGGAFAQLNVPIVRTLPVIGDPPIGVLAKLPVLAELDQSIGYVDLLGAKALPDIEPLLSLEQMLDIKSLLALGSLPLLGDLLSMDGMSGFDTLPSLGGLPSFE
ncbi:MAG: hypothetical protein ACJA1I_000938 [Zhongshania marina]|jgi:hypothetical protein